MATGLLALFPGLPCLQFLITFSTQTGGGNKTRLIESVCQRGLEVHTTLGGNYEGCLAGGGWCKGIHYWLLIHNGLWITPAVYCPTYCEGVLPLNACSILTHTLMPKLILSFSVGIQSPFTLLPYTCTLSAAVPINSGSICDSYIHSWHWKGRCIDSTSHVGFNKAIWEIMALQERQDGGACIILYYQIQLEMR